jgi:hypothetical protein
MLVIRPKAAIPLAAMSKGGSLPDWYAGLDVWVSVP